MLPEFMLPELNLTETAVTVVNAWISAHPSYDLEVVFSCLNQKKAYDYLVEQGYDGIIDDEMGKRKNGAFGKRKYSR